MTPEEQAPVRCVACDGTGKYFDNELLIWWPCTMCVGGFPLPAPEETVETRDTYTTGAGAHEGARRHALKDHGIERALTEKVGQ